VRNTDEFDIEFFFGTIDEPANDALANDNR
jgi:hypothetical protein